MVRLEVDTARALPGHNVTAQGWREHPPTYVVTTLDTVFSPDLQLQMASAAGTVTEIPASHFPMLSQPARLAAVLADVASR